MPSILFGGGIKGGVGKSFFNRCLVQYFIHKDWKHTLVEADATIPDVARVYKDNCHIITLSDDPRKSSNPDIIFNEAIKRPVIVNLPSNANDPLNRWIRETNILDIGATYQVEIYKLFVTDGCYESLKIFKSSLEAFEGKLRHILIRNTGRLTNNPDFGYLEEDQEYQELITKYKIPVYDFPSLSSQDQFKIDKNCLMLEEAIKATDLLQPLGAQRVKTFLERVYTFFDGIEIIQDVGAAKDKTKIKVAEATVSPEENSGTKTKIKIADNPSPPEENIESKSKIKIADTALPPEENSQRKTQIEVAEPTPLQEENSESKTKGKVPENLSHPVQTDSEDNKTNRGKKPKTKKSEKEEELKVEF